jgi:hypothetical protein
MANAGLAPVLEREKLTGISCAAFVAERRALQFFREQEQPHRRRRGSCGRVRRCALRCRSPPARARASQTYLPAPHGCPGSRTVEQNVPALVPCDLGSDGRTIVAGDGADEIHPSAGRPELRAVWRRAGIDRAKSVSSSIPV